jgi:hypothetical protein
VRAGQNFSAGGDIWMAQAGLPGRNPFARSKLL